MLLLIVDSSIQIIERLEELISESGNITVIHKAFSYEATIKLLRVNMYDAVLLDSDLPGNESLEILKEIKNGSVETCVILLFSSNMNNYLQQKCKPLGVDFFFDKYYDFEEVIGLLHIISTGKYFGNNPCDLVTNFQKD